jgi:predicted nucleic acid-binding protein
MATLVDTSVWIHHFRSTEPLLSQLLNDDVVCCHPLIIGELACGNLKRRAETLQSLTLLPCTPIVEYDEIVSFIEAHHLFGQGLGWVDVHLLASAILHQIRLWTLDGPLQRAAKKLNCNFTHFE